MRAFWRNHGGIAVFIAIMAAFWGIVWLIASQSAEHRQAAQNTEAERWRVYEPAEGVVCVIYKDWRNGDTPPTCFAKGGE